jgi:prenylcysteine oxidase/farnesylcysteine lyase
MAIGRITNLYNPTWLNSRGAVGSVDEFAEKVGLGREFTTRMGLEWGQSLGLRQNWMGEIMEGSTRCNVSEWGMCL